MTTAALATSPSSTSARPTPRWRWSRSIVWPRRRAPHAEHGAARRPVSAFRRRTPVEFHPRQPRRAQPRAQDRRDRHHARRDGRAGRSGGDLALPILDYEHDGPDSLAADYDAVRPPFAETGTPRLPIGLNLGAQLFWQAKTFPDVRARRHILMYPQYWALQAVRRPCQRGDLARLPHRFVGLPRAAISRRLSMARAGAGYGAVRSADDVWGRAARSRCNRACSRHAGLCGIHDSNASLLPHLLLRAQPFSVVSTGTWVIAMSIGGDAVELDPTRDTLVNVNAFGAPVPSARFMGGREFATLVGEGPPGAVAARDRSGARTPLLLTPSVQQGSGPFPTRKPNGLAASRQVTRAHVAASFYLAMMTATALELIGAEGPTISKGRSRRTGRLPGCWRQRRRGRRCRRRDGDRRRRGIAGGRNGATSAQSVPTARLSRRRRREWGAYAARWRA